VESRLDLDLQLDWIMNNGEIQNPRNHNAYHVTSLKLQRLYSKQPSVDCEVEVSDLGVVRSILCWVCLELEEIRVEGEVEEVIGVERVWDARGVCWILEGLCVYLSLCLRLHVYRLRAS
jgi:hypothetical protein